MTDQPVRKKRAARHPLVQTVIEMEHEQIHKFVDAVAAGEPPDLDTLEMLAGKLSRWLAGEDVRLLFAKPLGGGPIPRQATRSKNYRLALKVAILIPSIGNEDAAIAAVAVAAEVPEGTVKAAFNRHRQASKKQAAAMAAASDNSRDS
jgi:hypothetical protein